MRIEIIGFAYEADLHCVDCAMDRFGSDITVDIANGWPKDNDGNGIHPIFYREEHDPAGEYCGDCKAEISPPYKE